MANMIVAEKEYRDILSKMSDKGLRMDLEGLRGLREETEQFIRWTVDEINDRKAEDNRGPTFGEQE